MRLLASDLSHNQLAYRRYPTPIHLSCRKEFLTLHSLRFGFPFSNPKPITNLVGGQSSQSRNSLGFHSSRCQHIHHKVSIMLVKINAPRMGLKSYKFTQPFSCQTGSSQRHNRNPFFSLHHPDYEPVKIEATL